MGSPIPVSEESKDEFVAMLNDPFVFYFHGKVTDKITTITDLINFYVRWKWGDLKNEMKNDDNEEEKESKKNQKKTITTRIRHLMLKGLSVDDIHDDPQFSKLHTSNCNCI